MYTHYGTKHKPILEEECSLQVKAKGIGNSLDQNINKNEKFRFENGKKKYVSLHGENKISISRAFVSLTPF